MDRLQRPLFRPGVGGIDEGFGEVDLPAVPEIRGEALEEAIEAATLLPLLKPPVARLVRGIAGRQIGPRGASAQDPEHAVEYGARIGPRSPAAIRSATRTKRRFEKGPLGVGEVHTATYDGSRSVVTRRVTDL